MLIEIQCDKFMDEGKIRKPIRFRKGLNAVLGGGRAQNSIGKSTFLMIIDFVFGGKDYVTINVDVTNNVGVHEIRFCFQFGEELFYFSRSTGNHTVVQKCSETYEPLAEISVSEYCRFLAVKYGVDQTGASFRDMVSGYFRVYGRNNYDEKRPLTAFRNDKQEEGIRRLLQLFQKYERVEEMRAVLKEEEEKARAYRDAFSYQFILGVTRKSDYEKNRNRIAVLTEQREELVKQSSQGVLDRDSVQAERLAEAKKNLRMMRLQEQEIRYQLDAMKADMDLGRRGSSKDFEDLLEFFPDADIRHLEEIEAFHEQLKRVLRSEYNDTQRNLQAQLRMSAYMIALSEQQVKQVNKAVQVSQAILERYSEIDREIRNLEAANGYYDNMEAMRKTIAELQERLNGLIENITVTLQNDINLELKRLNEIVCDGRKTSPSIAIKGMTKYTYQTPNDIGAGSQTRGMFLFDIVMLEKTVLPAVIHDSHSIKQIEDPVMVKIMELYDAQPKQVFIAIDKGDTYSETGTMPEVLKESVVLRLSPGHELFGRAWNQPEAEGREEG